MTPHARDHTLRGQDGHVSRVSRRSFTREQRVLCGPAQRCLLLILPSIGNSRAPGTAGESQWA